MVFIRFRIIFSIIRVQNPIIHMNFFTKKSIYERAKRPESNDGQRGPIGFCQKRSLIISVLCALLLLMASLVKAGTNTVPAMPGLITGQKNVCAYVGTTQAINYSINVVP